jgi:hypothetical protein
MEALCPAADRDDVLFEQLEYLCLHRETCAAENCACCIRLARAASALMTPFWKALDE